MTKAIYVHVTIAGGPVYFGSPNYYPNSYLTSDLLLDGYRVTSLYVLVDQLRGGGGGWDYFYYTNAVDQVSFTRPADTSEKLTYVDPDGAPTVRNAWYTVYVPDDFVIPYNYDTTGLSNGFRYTLPDKSTVGLENVTFDFNTSFAAGVSFGDFQLGTNSTIKTIIDSVTSALGLSNISAAINNAIVVRDTMKNFTDSSVNLLTTGIQGVGDPNFDYAAYDAQVQAHVAGAGAAFESALDDLVLVPGDAAGDELAHNLVNTMRFVGNGYAPVSGSATFGVELSIGGVVTVTTEITGTATGMIVIDGGQNSELMGWAENNMLMGGGGDDLIWGDAGRDYLNGGTGDDAILGYAGRDYITAGDGTDSLWGDEGDDTLIGGGGVDYMTGGADNDTYYVDDAGDITWEDAAGGADTVRSSVTWTLAAETERLELLGTAALNATGNTAANVIVGNAGANILNGLAGADQLSGGLGNDTYYVDNALDLATEDLNAGIDTVVASRSWAVASNFEKVILSGTGDFNVAGNGLANNLKGNNGDNWLNGSFGKDTLTGGGGRDSFIFNRTLGPNNIDTITDYDVVRDVIRIDNAVFAGIGPAGALAAGMFNTGAAATQADDRIIYDQATGKLFFDIDGTGAAAQIHFATLSTKPTGMSAAEFIVI